MKWLIVVGFVLMAGAAFAADDSSMVGGHNAQTGTTRTLHADSIFGCQIKIGGDDPKQYRWLRHITVRIANSGSKSNVDTARCAIYKQSDMSLISATEKKYISVAGSSSATVNCAFLDTVSLFRDTVYILMMDMKTAEGLLHPVTGDTTGDTTITMNRTWASGWPTTLIRQASVAGKAARMALWLGTESADYGLTHHISIGGEVADSLDIKDSITFVGIGDDSHDSTKLFLKAVTSPPTSTVFSDPDTTIVFDTTMGGVSNLVLNWTTTGNPTNGVVVGAAVSYSDTVNQDDSVIYLTDTSDFAYFYTGVNTLDTFTLVVGDSLWSTVYDGSITEWYPDASYGGAGELRAMTLNTGGEDVKSLISFPNLSSLIADSCSILSTTLSLTTAEDQSQLATGTTTMRIQLIYEDFGELIPGTATGYPSWVKRTAAANWADSGCASFVHAEKYVDVDIDSIPMTTHNIDVSHMIAWARYMGVTPRFLMWSVDTTGWSGRRTFCSSEYDYDMSKRPTLTVVATRVARQTPVKYVAGPAGVRVVSGPDGPSTVAGGFGE